MLPITPATSNTIRWHLRLDGTEMLVWSGDRGFWSTVLRLITWCRGDLAHGGTQGSIQGLVSHPKWMNVSVQIRVWCSKESRGGCIAEETLSPLLEPARLHLRSTRTRNHGTPHIASASPLWTSSPTAEICLRNLRFFLRWISVF